MTFEELGRKLDKIVSDRQPLLVEVRAKDARIEKIVAELEGIVDAPIVTGEAGFPQWKAKHIEREEHRLLRALRAELKKEAEVTIDALLPQVTVLHGRVA